MCFACPSNGVECRNAETSPTPTANFAEPERVVRTVFVQHDRDGRPSLQTQMGFCKRAFRRIYAYLQEAARKHLDLTKSLAQQPSVSYENYMNAVQTSCEKLKDFEEAWPATAYARIYLKGRKQYLRYLRRKHKMLNKNGMKRHHMRTPVSEVLRPSHRPSAAKLVPVVLLSRRPRQAAACPFQNTEIPECTIARPTPTRAPLPTHESVEEFLRSLNPPQPELIPIFQNAGVRNCAYLRALADDASALQEFLVSLREDGQLQRVHVPLMKSAILKTFGPVGRLDRTA